MHQLSASPNAGTIIFQPSPSQSPAPGATIVGTVTGNEFNTTLVGSNNILLNKVNYILLIVYIMLYLKNYKISERRK